MSVVSTWRGQQRGICRIHVRSGLLWGTVPYVN